MVRLTVLPDEALEEIHAASLRILGEIGVVLRQAEAREILTGAGAQVNGQRVLMLPDVVEGAVAQCPGQVALHGRGDQSVTLGDGALYWHNLGGARTVYDPHIDGRRPATVDDVRNSARLLDALDSVTAVTPFFTPLDVPGPLMSLAMYRHTLPHTTKPVHGPGVHTADEVRFIARMAGVFGPPAEVLTLGISPVSPLFFPDDVAEAIIETARQGVTLGPLPCPIAGATATMTLAGALAQQNAEVLAAVVLAQSVRPGLPIFYCGRLAMLEPRSGLSVWGGVELGLASAATVQIGHRYRLPVNVYGLSTNAHLMDIQNGMERALNAAIPALAGADELSGVGEVEAGVMGSYAQMVCDDEIAGGIARLRRGFAVEDHTLAVDVVQAVMDSPRSFLAHRHTAATLRAGEMFVPRLADRLSWDAWEGSAREGMAERAQAEADRLLAQHQVPPLADEQEQELDHILNEAHSRLVISADGRR